MLLGVNCFFAIFIALVLCGCVKDPKPQIEKFVEEAATSGLHAKLEGDVFGRLVTEMAAKADIHRAKDGEFDGTVAVSFVAGERFVVKGDEPEVDASEATAKILALKTQLEAENAIWLDVPDRFQASKYMVSPGVIEVVPIGTVFTFTFQVSGTYGDDSCLVKAQSLVNITPVPRADAFPASSADGMGKLVYASKEEYDIAYKFMQKKGLEKYASDAGKTLRDETARIAALRAPFSPGSRYSMQYTVVPKEMTVVFEVLAYDKQKDGSIPVGFYTPHLFEQWTRRIPPCVSLGSFTPPKRASSLPRCRPKSLSGKP